MYIHPVTTSLGLYETAVLALSRSLKILGIFRDLPLLHTYCLCHVPVSFDQYGPSPLTTVVMCHKILSVSEILKPLHL